MRHNLNLSQCLLRDNYVEIAARVRRERSLAVRAAIVSAIRACGRVAAKAASLATSLWALTRASPPAAAQEPGARALPVEPATWICPGAPIVLPASVQQTIACDAGTVWITQGDCEDYVLTAGQCLALTPADEVIVSAMAAPAVVRRIAGLCALENMSGNSPGAALPS